MFCRMLVAHRLPFSKVEATTCFGQKLTQTVA